LSTYILPEPIMFVFIVDTGFAPARSCQHVPKSHSRLQEGGILMPLGAGLAVIMGHSWLNWADNGRDWTPFQVDFNAL